MRPRSPAGALGEDLDGIPPSRRYRLRQDRIVLTPRVQAAIDPLALFEQVGSPCSDVGDALLVCCPGRFDFEIGLIRKTPQALLARARALFAPSVIIFPSHRTPDPIRICWRAKPSYLCNEYYTGWV